MSSAKEIAKSYLRIHEGLKLKAYKDSVGITTIGYGRNLEQNGITKDEAEILLHNDVSNIVDKLENYEFYKNLDSSRQAIIIDMVFNLGYGGFLTFDVLIHHLKNKDFIKASEAMLKSKWSNQVGNRAKVLAALMRGIGV